MTQDANGVPALRVEHAARAILNGRHTAIYEVPKEDRPKVHARVRELEEDNAKSQ